MLVLADALISPGEVEVGKAFYLSIDIREQETNWQSLKNEIATWRDVKSRYTLWWQVKQR